MEIKTALSEIIKGRDLQREDMTSVMFQILEGRSTDAQIGAFLAALSIKGESIDEVVGVVSVMRELSEKVEVDTHHLVDTCGTGGTGVSIFNVSTASAFIACACGAKVAKHGNTSATRKSGSADLLEEAGLSLELSPKEVSRCIEEIGIGFMFAPAHHTAMKHAVGPRKEMGIKTIFNIVGPLTNPAGALNQVIGVYNKRWLKPIAEVLRELGSQHVLVVHSKDHLDEISIANETYVTELINGSIQEYVIKPEDFGFKKHSLEDLIVSSASESLSIIKQGFLDKNQAASSMIAMNAGAALYASGVTVSLKEGVINAMECIKGGKGLKKLDELISFSQSLV
ncbi:MAG: anthranilate phosphoribosyltransferase [SAR86 cluster bacterium]|nr:anthranilate phosphoribosyltransferase [SAR86 cluster bacterium]